VWSGPSSRLTGAREREGKREARARVRDTQRERERARRVVDCVGIAG
jgi:hypothetical protein